MSITLLKIECTKVSVTFINFLFCPVPIAFGESGTGKTTALQCGMAMLAGLTDRFHSKCSLE